MNKGQTGKEWEKNYNKGNGEIGRKIQVIKS